MKLRSENYAHLPAVHIVWNLGEKALIGKNDHKLLQGQAKFTFLEKAQERYSKKLFLRKPSSLRR